MKKSIVMIIAIVMLLSVFTILNSNKVYATDVETDLNEIYEVYENAEDLPEGMVLAPNPNVDDEDDDGDGDDLEEILEVYDNPDEKEGDLAVLSSEEVTTIGAETATSTDSSEGLSPAAIIGIVVACVVVLAVIIFIVKKR